MLCGKELNLNKYLHQRLIFYFIVYRNQNILSLALRVKLYTCVGPYVPIKCNAFSTIVYVLNFCPHLIKIDMVCFEMA